jgi:mercuric ion transport protein
MAMKDRALIATGAVGVVLAAICCVAPLLAVVLGAFGLKAWLANSAYVLIPVLLICLALIGLRFRRRQTAAAGSDSATNGQVRKS